ncbi:hypothetical protein AMAG_05710 [Allomyces macrogynus ATCC 38327]|uniref:Phosphodiesterase n=1 Tax=Allomyces macrogynus (strain ATCC 38327) TaxID=578462 RepID=A0A0L0SCN5_ALLM3|nr:hypothetical protein AMAG_05710 [Allomyces macrogynus ATCC 38327]|eukprot:KNE60308.1 hypothetical protein AMAG_05710 [Allomyces macrogynus ATCC 38327]
MSPQSRASFAAGPSTNGPGPGPGAGGPPHAVNGDGTARNPATPDSNDPTANGAGHPGPRSGSGSMERYQYPSEYVKELRKERDMYQRTLLHSVGPNAPARGNPTPPPSQAHGDSTLLDAAPSPTPSSRIAAAAHSGGERAPTSNSGNNAASAATGGNGTFSRTAATPAPAGTGSRPTVAGSRSVVHSNSSVIHQSGENAFPVANAAGRAGSTMSLTAPFHTPGQPAAAAAGGRPAHPLATMTVRRRASVMSYSSTHSKRNRGLAGAPAPMQSLSRTQHGKAASVPVGPGGNSSPRARLSTVLTNASNTSNPSRPVSKVGTAEDTFEPLVGSITLQMPFHYLWYGCLLFIGYAVGWVGSTRPVTISFYFATVFTITQLSRIIYAVNQYSLVPLYLSFVPFFEFCLLAREGHILFSVLWFISLMVINMQCGASSLRLHILGSSLCMLAVYVLAAMGLMWSASPINVFNATSGAIMSELAPITINVAAEGTFLLFMLLLQSALFMLQRFIKRYAYFLIDRQRRMQKLQAANAELQDKLKALKTEVDLDLDSPITKVIQIIKGIQAKAAMDPEVVESLDYVIGILSSNKLFHVDLNAFKEHIDTDVRTWLDNMFQTKETQPSPDLNPGGAMAAASTQDLPAATAGSVTASTTAVPGAAGGGAGTGGGMGGVPAAIPEIVYKPVLPNDAQIQAVLQQSESWDFNCFELAQLTNGHPLAALAHHLFARYDFWSAFRFDACKVDAFLHQIEAGYRINPYHNSIHATDVTQTIHYFLSVLGMADLISVEERLACILAACVHDVDHPGVNNAFLIEARNVLSVRYNDQAVLESHHCARAFEWLLTKDECNFLAALPPATVKHIRQCIVRMVLATDMSMHFEFVTKFKNKVAGQGINVQDGKDRTLLMEIAIKCADVSNPTKIAPLAQKWTELVIQEFYLQGDAERARGLPISGFMDRHNPGIAKCQVAFIDFIVLPLYQIWDQYMNEDGTFKAVHNIYKRTASSGRRFQDPPPGTALEISSIPTPDYLIDSATRPLDVSSFPPIFTNVPTVCKFALPRLPGMPAETLESADQDARKMRAAGAAP